ncbi:hypothetical protein ACSBR2_018063 [Camellia fascicularis]
MDMIQLQIMNMRSNKRLLSSKWNKVLCAHMDSVLEKAFMDGRTWNVSLSSDNVFEVHCFSSVMVDLGLKTCSCRKWKINGYPCQHNIATNFRSGKDLNLFVEPFFHADMYRQAYLFSIGLVLTIEKPVCSIDDVMILPLLSKRPVGRPKNDRIAFTGEFKRVMKCNRYESIGRHNKRTCNETLLNS